MAPAFGRDCWATCASSCAITCSPCTVGIERAVAEEDVAPSRERLEAERHLRAVDVDLDVVEALAERLLHALERRDRQSPVVRRFVVGGPAARFGGDERLPAGRARDQLIELAAGGAAVLLGIDPGELADVGLQPAAARRDACRDPVEPPLGLLEIQRACAIGGRVTYAFPDRLRLLARQAISRTLDDRIERIPLAPAIQLVRAHPSLRLLHWRASVAPPAIPGKTSARRTPPAAPSCRLQRVDTKTKFATQHCATALGTAKCEQCTPSRGCIESLQVTRNRCVIRMTPASAAVRILPRATDALCDAKPPAPLAAAIAAALGRERGRSRA